LKICIEDTRNFDLYNLIINQWGVKGQIEIAKLLILSKKRWMNNKDDWLEKLVKGYIAQIDDDHWPEDKVRRTIFNSSDLAEWYSCVFAVFNSDDRSKMIRAFVESLKNRMYSQTRLPNRNESKFLMATTLGFNELLALCDLGLGYWNSGMNEYMGDEEYVKPNYIPKFQDYTHDNMTTTGKNRLYKHWFSIRFGKKQPPKIDMRWSGMMYGLLWRQLAFRKVKGDLREIDWKEIEVDGKFLELAQRLDGCLHKLFYGMVHFMNFRLDDDPLFTRIVSDCKGHEDLVRPVEFFGTKRDNVLFKQECARIYGNIDDQVQLS